MIRFKDLEGLEQEKCAGSMRVSRTTFSRILESARLKMADALLNGKAPPGETPLVVDHWFGALR